MFLFAQSHFISLKLTIALAATFLLFTGSTTNAATTHNQVEVIQTVRNTFPDVPAMVEIAHCESKFRQYTNSGTPFYGGYGSNMVGVFQVYESVHKQTASTLGYDLTTLKGNIGYARYLYETQGLTPWNSSKNCWEDALNTPVITTEQPTRTELETKLKQLHQLVALLKQLLELKAQLAMK